MTVCVKKTSTGWQREISSRLEGAGSLTDEHRKKIIHGDSDWICAHFQRSSEQDFMRSEKEIKCEL